MNSKDKTFGNIRRDLFGSSASSARLEDSPNVRNREAGVAHPQNESPNSVSEPATNPASPTPASTRLMKRDRFKTPAEMAGAQETFPGSRVIKTGSQEEAVEALRAVRAEINKSTMGEEPKDDTQQPSYSPFERRLPKLPESSTSPSLLPEIDISIKSKEEIQGANNAEMRSSVLRPTRGSAFQSLPIPMRLSSEEQQTTAVGVEGANSVQDAMRNSLNSAPPASGRRRVHDTERTAR